MYKRVLQETKKKKRDNVIQASNKTKATWQLTIEKLVKLKKMIII